MSLSGLSSTGAFLATRRRYRPAPSATRPATRCTVDDAEGQRREFSGAGERLLLRVPRQTRCCDVVTCGAEKRVTVLRRTHVNGTQPLGHGAVPVSRLTQGRRVRHASPSFCWARQQGRPDRHLHKRARRRTAVGVVEFLAMHHITALAGFEIVIIALLPLSFVGAASASPPATRTSVLGRARTWTRAPRTSNNTSLGHASVRQRSRSVLPCARRALASASTASMTSFAATWNLSAATVAFESLLTLGAASIARWRRLRSCIFGLRFGRAFATTAKRLRLRGDYEL